MSRRLSFRKLRSYLKDKNYLIVEIYYIENSYGKTTASSLYNPNRKLCKYIKCKSRMSLKEFILYIPSKYILELDKKILFPQIQIVSHKQTFSRQFDYLNKVGPAVNFDIISISNSYISHYSQKNALSNYILKKAQEVRQENKIEKLTEFETNIYKRIKSLEKNKKLEERSSYPLGGQSPLSVNTPDLHQNEGPIQVMKTQEATVEDETSKIVKTEANDERKELPVQANEEEEGPIRPQANEDSQIVKTKEANTEDSDFDTNEDSDFDTNEDSDFHTNEDSDFHANEDSDFHANEDSDFHANEDSEGPKTRPKGLVQIVKTNEAKSLIPQGPMEDNDKAYTAPSGGLIPPILSQFVKTTETNEEITEQGIGASGLIDIQEIESGTDSEAEEDIFIEGGGEANVGDVHLRHILEGYRDSEEYLKKIQGEESVENTTSTINIGILYISAPINLFFKSKDDYEAEMIDQYDRLDARENKLRKSEMEHLQEKAASFLKCSKNRLDTIIQEEEKIKLYIEKLIGILDNINRSSTKSHTVRQDSKVLSLKTQVEDQIEEFNYQLLFLKDTMDEYLYRCQILLNRLLLGN